LIAPNRFGKIHARSLQVSLTEIEMVYRWRKCWTNQYYAFKFPVKMASLWWQKLFFLV